MLQFPLPPEMHIFQPSLGMTKPSLDQSHPWLSSLAKNSAERASHNRGLASGALPAEEARASCQASFPTLLICRCARILHICMGASKAVFGWKEGKM